MASTAPPPPPPQPASLAGQPPLIRIPPLNTYPPPTTSPSSPIAPVTYSHTITEKLYNNNVLLRRKQIKPIIKTQPSPFSLLVDNSPHFLTTEDCDLGRINESYAAWEQQDQLLLSWLQASLRFNPI